MRESMADPKVAANDALRQRTRESTETAHALEEEERVTHRERRVRKQGRAPRKEFAYECRRLKRIARAKRPPLSAAGTAFAPHEHLSVGEQRQGLQAVA